MEREMIPNIQGMQAMTQPEASGDYESIKAEKDRLICALGEMILKEDLRKLQELDPSLQIGSPFEMGEDFVQLMSKGIDLEDAFKLWQWKKEKLESERAISTGSLGSDFSAVRDFFTAQEVSNMSAGDVSRNYDKIKSSMNRW